MPRYISFHTIACLTRQGAEELSAHLHRATDCFRGLKTAFFAMQFGALEIRRFRGD